MTTGLYLECLLVRKQSLTQLIIQASESEVCRLIWPDIRACHHSIARSALNPWFLRFLFPPDAETLVQVTSISWLDIRIHRTAVSFEIRYSFVMELAHYNKLMLVSCSNQDRRTFIFSSAESE
jgi:hypothetical protein